MTSDPDPGGQCHEPADCDDNKNNSVEVTGVPPGGGTLGNSSQAAFSNPRYAYYSVESAGQSIAAKSLPQTPQDHFFGGSAESASVRSIWLFG